MIRNLYHLVLVVGVWLLKKLKIFENLSGFQGSATIVVAEEKLIERRKSSSAIHLPP